MAARRSGAWASGSGGGMVGLLPRAAAIRSGAGALACATAATGGDAVGATGTGTTCSGVRGSCAELARAPPTGCSGDPGARCAGTGARGSTCATAAADGDAVGTTGAGTAFSGVWGSCTELARTPPTGCSGDSGPHWAGTGARGFVCATAAADGDAVGATGARTAFSGVWGSCTELARVPPSGCPGDPRPHCAGTGAGGFTFTLLWPGGAAVGGGLPGGLAALPASLARAMACFHGARASASARCMARSWAAVVPPFVYGGIRSSGGFWAKRAARSAGSRSRYCSAARNTRPRRAMLRMRRLWARHPAP
jgi:hypothetical protein